jgi:hypothetical protein
LRFFYLSRGEEKGKRDRNQERKNKERAIHPPANSNLPGGSIAREKERVSLFINRGKSPLFYKKQYKRRKSKGKSIVHGRCAFEKIRTDFAQNL